MLPFIYLSYYTRKSKSKKGFPQVDGGALKIYSACVEGVVAKVDPIFDRIIFFWSDRRNPHEVLPAFRERYAVTVWYMDETEKRIFDEKKNLNPKADET